MNNPNDFVIENGVLKKYVGPGGDVVVPDGVTEIGNDAFNGNKTLTSITIPEGATVIGWSAFCACEELEEISLPEGLKEIGGSAFSGCNKITNLCLPESLKTIEQNAFWGNHCKSIVIPANVSKMGESGGDVFYGEELESIEVDPNNRSFCGVDGVLYNKKKTKLLFCPAKKAGTIKVEDGTTSIVAGAFQGCKELTQIILPQTMEKIGRVAFCGCSKLQTVSIPASVTQIGESAFEGCMELSELKIDEGVTKIGVGAFARCPALAKVKLPKTIDKLGPDTFPKETVLICAPAVFKKLSKEAKYRIAEYYLTNQTEFGAEEASSVEAFVSAEKKAMPQKLMESGNAAAIMVFHSKYPLTGKQLESLVKEATERNNPAVTAVLLEIGQKK